MKQISGKMSGNSWGLLRAVKLRAENCSSFIYLLKFIAGYFNSQVVGMDSWVQSALKSIFMGDPIFESAAWIFFIILKFIFTSIFEIKVHEKKSTNKFLI